MKRILFLLLNMLTLAGYAQYPVTSINITMPGNTPANTADWATAMPPVMITAQAQMRNGQVPGDVQESKILATIKQSGSKKYGSYTPDNAPSAGFTTAVKNWSGSSATSLLGKDVVLPPGTYELCVQFFSYNTPAKPLSNEVCKTFTIQGSKDEKYSPPVNINPVDNKVFDEKEIKAPITFQWTPVVPKPQNVIYRLKVWQLMQGQTASQAMQTTEPLIQEEVKDQTQFMYRKGWDGTVKGSYIWRVDAVDKDGKVLGSSTPTVFKISSCFPDVEIHLTNAVCNAQSQSVISGSITAVTTSGTTINSISFNKIVEYPSLAPITTASVLPSVIATSGTTPISITATNAQCKKVLVEYKITYTCLSGTQTNYCSDTLTLPCCSCNYCSKNVEFDDNQPTITYSGTTLNIVHPIWNMSGTPLVGVKAEIIEFDRYVGDECMTCNKDASLWGNFIGGTYGVPGALAVATSGVTGNTHHSIYFSGPGLGMPFNLNISTPPLSNLSCCCDKITVSIRYTFIFKDGNECRYCSQVQKYNYQQGSCPAIPNGNTGTMNNLKNN